MMIIGAMGGKLNHNNPNNYGRAIEAVGFWQILQLLLLRDCSQKGTNAFVSDTKLGLR
jgi:hypothetical protein